MTDADDTHRGRVDNRDEVREEARDEARDDVGDEAADAAADEARDERSDQEPAREVGGEIVEEISESDSATGSVLDDFFGDDESVVPQHTPGFRAGYVALIGRPNVGKSTLMNRFLKERLAIVTAKPQTTRRKTLGILNSSEYQIVLLDTPGIMEPRYDLHEAMVREATDALNQADIVVFLADASAPAEVLPAVAASTAPRILALNKVDRIGDKGALLPLLGEYGALADFQAIVPISALSGEGVDKLLSELVSRLPEAPPFYPPDQIAEQPERFFVAEIVRERIFELYDQEIPYSTEVIVDTFQERKKAKDFIEAVVYVESDSQKAILIGKGGRAIRVLGEDAREAVESFLGREVFLSLRVKRMPKWRKKAGALKKLGYRM